MKLLVDLDLLVEFSLQLLFSMFQALDLLLCLIHLSLYCLQSLSQLQSEKKVRYLHMRQNSLRTFSLTAFVTNLVSLALQVQVFLICLHLHLLHFALQLAVALL